jgi:predicted ATPase
VPVAELLERELELQALTATVETVRSGHGAAVFVRGEAGIGKTSLVHALRERAGLRVHVGRCEPLSVPEPLGPVRELAAAVGAADMPELTADDRRAPLARCRPH